MRKFHMLQYFRCLKHSSSFVVLHIYIFIDFTVFMQSFQLGSDKELLDRISRHGSTHTMAYQVITEAQSRSSPTPSLHSVFSQSHCTH
jgi:hypothetical protein